MNAYAQFTSSSFARLVATIGLTVALVVGWFCLPGPAWAQSSPHTPDVLGSLAGVVTNDSGEPLADIEVRTYIEYVNGYPSLDQPVRITKTDAAGAYKVAALPVGTYYLRFTDPAHIYGAEYYTNSATFEGGSELVLTGNQRTGINAVLGAGGRITGTVTLQGEALVSNATVTLYAQHASSWEIVATHTVTQTGRYDSSALLPGIYRICGVTWLSGSNSQLVGCYGGSMTVDEATDVVIVAGEIQANQEISLGDGQFDGAIAGVVTANGVPVAGIEVDLYTYFYYGYFSKPQAYVVTDAAGRYRIDGLGTGLYQIGFFDPAGVYATIFHPDRPTLPRAGFVSLQSSQVISDVNAALVHGGKISGTVRRTGGAPVAGALIQLFWQSALDDQSFEHTGAFVETDSAGHYTLTGVLPGIYRVGASSCQPPYSCYLEYYGSDFSLYAAKSVIVEVDKTTSGIDITLGPDYQLFLPLTQR